MKTTIALIIKFIISMAAAWIAFMIFGTASFWTMLMIAIAGTVLNFLIGDMLILPRFGNVTAAVLDGILGGVVAWLILIYTPVTNYSITSVYFFAVIVAVAEFFFHMYLVSARVVEKKKSDNTVFKTNKPNYGTETGSELYPYSEKDRFSDSLGGGGYSGNSGDNGYNSSRSSYSGTINSGYNKGVNRQDQSEVASKKGKGGSRT